jgi:signal transduction histidine kinase
MSVEFDKIKNAKPERMKGRSLSRFFLFGFAFLPLLWGIALSIIILSQETPGFSVEEAQDCFVVSRVDTQINPISKGDCITHISGEKFDWVLGALFEFNKELTKPETITIKNNGTFKTITCNTVPITPAEYIKDVWLQVLLVLIITFLVTTALLKAPANQPAGLVLLGLTLFSLIIINQVPFQFGLLAPWLISFAFISVAVFHWLAFSAWVHFVFQFPIQRQFLTGHPFILAGIYILPPFVAIGVSFVMSDSSHSFMGLLQHYRMWATPWIIAGTLLKHAIDYRKVKSSQAKSQLKLLLYGGSTGIGPYFFLYLFPNILFGHPIISFRVVILFGMLIPLAIFLAIIRYKLMDVDQLISKGATYIILILSLIIGYSGFIVLLKQWVWGQGLLSQEFSLGLILFIALVFNPLKTWLQNLIDRIFLKDQLHYDLLLHNFSNKIAKSIKLSDLIELLTEHFPEEFRIQKTVLIISDNKRVRVYPEQSYLAKHIESRQILINTLKSKKKYLCVYEDDLDLKFLDAVKIMNKMDYPVVYGLQSSNIFFGGLVLGNKINNKIYSKTEIKIIATLINTASIAMENCLMYESLKESHDQIHQMFNKVTQAEKLATIGEMTAVLAHEFRNPLGIIRSSAEYLTTKKRDEKIQEELLSNIIEEADTLNIVINNTLGLAKYKTPEFNQIDVGDHIRGLLKRWIKSSEHNGRVNIKFTNPPVFKIFADEKQLSQVFINLIMNSEEAMPDGGEINIEIHSKKDGVVLLFKDTGFGISQEHKKNILKKFYTSKENGLGLGLAVCEQIVNAHNGLISLENNESRGVCARVCLPCRPYKKMPLSLDEPG